LSGELGVLAAQALPTGDGGGSAFGMLLPLAAMFLLLWALVIRPQQRQQKEQRQMLAQIQKGDWIVTTGGIHGRVMGLADDVLTVEIAPQVRVKLDRGSVRTRRSAEEPREAKESKS
jgi:preprotein translocase subunit YajC